MIDFLLQAVRDTLRTAMTADHKTIGVRAGGQPPATMGQWFIGIDEGGEDSDQKLHLAEISKVAVSLTVRLGVFPGERTDEIYLNSLRGFRTYERQIKRALHGNQAVRTAANVLLAAAATADYYPFQTPVYYVGRGPTSFHGSEWLLGAGEKNSNSAFAVRVYNFTGGHRLADNSHI